LGIMPIVLFHCYFQNLVYLLALNSSLLSSILNEHLANSDNLTVEFLLILLQNAFVRLVAVLSEFIGAETVRLGVLLDVTDGLDDVRVVSLIRYYLLSKQLQYRSTELNLYLQVGTDD
jgi:hypothetical protein